ncbi:MAG TPA: hypothetical protein DCM27_04080 [Rhodospirillaceae bacterium]|nr:hypothetical protein [Rhodospirillaceae bacterium]
MAQITEYKCADFDGPADIVKVYLAQQGCVRAERAVIAIAGSADNPSNIVFTNGPWGQKPLHFTAIPADRTETMNDFAAVCYSIATLGEMDCTTLIRRQSAPFFPATLLAAKDCNAKPARILTSSPAHRFVTIGPGTGLGVGMGLVTDNGQFLVVTSEGGHCAFAPDNEEELKIKQYLESENGIAVTNETFASGTGLVTAFNSICKIRDIDCAILNGSEVVAKLGNANSDIREAADRTLNLFSRTLGTCAASAVLMSNARTVFIGGGVLKKLGAHFNKATFTHAFMSNDLGKNNALLDIPVMIVDPPQPGLAGADFYLKLTA